jgi:ATP-dependent Clp protease ATP-binding subunit ClpA
LKWRTFGRTSNNGSRQRKESPQPSNPIRHEHQRVLRLAEEEAEALRHDYVGTEHLGLLREGESMAASLLTQWGMSVEKVRDDLVSLLARMSPPT